MNNWLIDPDWDKEAPAGWSLGNIGFKIGTAVSVDCPAVLLELIMISAFLDQTVQTKQQLPLFSLAVFSFL